MLQIPLRQALHQDFPPEAEPSVLLAESFSPAQVTYLLSLMPQAVTAPNRIAHRPGTLRLNLQQIAVRRLSLPDRMHISPVKGQIYPGTDLQPHIAIYACAGIPAAVGALMTHLHQQFVLPLHQIFRDIMVKCGIAIFPVPHLFAVNIESTVHIDAVETKKHSLAGSHMDCARAACFFHKDHRNMLPIPARAVLIEISGVVDQPVMGQVHRTKRIVPPLQIG